MNFSHEMAFEYNNEILKKCYIIYDVEAFFHFHSSVFYFLTRCVWHVASKLIARRKFHLPDDATVKSH